nr:hypothetical protein [Tanacetum cinerariifolium]
MSLFGQDADTFTRGNNQFQKFIDSRVTLDYDSQMTEKYFVEYTGIEVKNFRDKLLQHMENVKKSVFERARHQKQYDRRKVVEQNQKCKMTTAGQRMIQMLLMQISDPFMTKSQ